MFFSPTAKYIKKDTYSNKQITFWKHVDNYDATARDYTLTNINALDEAELFKCKSTTESLPTLSLRQCVIRYTGV